MAAMELLFIFIVSLNHNLYSPVLEDHLKLPNSV